MLFILLYVCAEWFFLAIWGSTFTYMDKSQKFCSRFPCYRRFFLWKKNLIFYYQEFLTVYDIRRTSLLCCQKRTAYYILFLWKFSMPRPTSSDVFYSLFPSYSIKYTNAGFMKLTFSYFWQVWNLLDDSEYVLTIVGKIFVSLCLSIHPYRNLVAVTQSLML